ncbi:hypothetical protein LUZ61_011798 [Rhynchospora tenuis]|uniref:CUE domain-containing protein n=1 Tax=Rhynchospora tenuis TaxID=198213 RepID=A0AAD6A1V9_9POAL|nr:hypothetical protein LUZ61_011798 [Rhynchospora tenuis]
MSALVVCGKRSSSSFFDEDSPQQILHSSSSSPSPSHPASKRARCGGASFSPPPAAALGFSEAGFLLQLISLFPEMDPKILEEALEASGNDLETAIRNLNKLRLESSVADLSSNDHKFENGTSCTEGNKAFVENGNMESTSDQPSNGSNIPSHMSEWVELFVREMMNASNIDDARARASRAIEVFEKAVLQRAGVDAVENLHKENMVLKEQLENVLRENSILKRAVAIQHDRQKEFVNTTEELSQLKQLVAQYQEQVRTLEINNYALTMHLRQAQQNNSIPGRFNPDVF